MQVSVGATCDAVKAPHTISARFHTPVEDHHPMEPGATVADWRDGSVWNLARIVWGALTAHTKSLGTSRTISSHASPVQTLWSANAGQCCVAAKRFILEEPIADEFVNRFKAALAKFIPGDPTDPKTTLAPLCTERALTLVESQIDSAVKGGATVLMGGKRVDRQGYFLEPTILSNVTPENPMYHQEFFAPVAMIFPVKNDDEAVKLANDSPYGLGGSIITNDVERGKRVARQIDTGMVFVNQACWTASDLPFGGVKNSGYGRELSDLGIGEFVNKKLIRVV
jgi:succinate-semialdehyde dehydrogenase/glutarate-semialdehyde dehydrogenase